MRTFHHGLESLGTNHLGLLACESVESLEGGFDFIFSQECR